MRHLGAAAVLRAVRTAPRLCLLYPGIRLNTEKKIREKYQSGYSKSASWTRLIGRHGHRSTSSLDDSIVPGLPFDPLGDLGQPSVSAGLCRDAELKGSPHQLTLSPISQLETYVVS